MDTALQTFGIELELLCLRPAYLPPTISPSQPGSNQIIDAIYDALLAHDISISDHNSLSINDGALPFSQWRVEEEVLSLTPEEEELLPEGYVVEPVELASRKFYYAHEDWRAEVNAVLAALRELEAAYGVKFMTNSSAGFHVHVGYSDASTSASIPVPLRTAKNVFLFATAFEPLIDTLHATPRIAIPWEKKERHHCYPLSFFATKRRHGDELFERLQFIERMQSYDDIGSAFFMPADEMGGDEQCTGHNAAYNFDNLFPDEGNGRYAETLTGTIEFRQHAGTFDFDAIVAWVELTTAIVRYAADSGADVNGMQDFVGMLASATDPKVGWDNFLNESLVAVPHEVREYYDAVTSGTLTLPYEPQVQEIHAPLLPLLRLNHAVNTTDFSRRVVQTTIADKFAHGTYGHDPVAAPFVFPETCADEILAVRLGDDANRGFRAVSAEEMSTVIQGALGELAEAHQEVLLQAVDEDEE